MRWVSTWHPQHQIIPQQIDGIDDHHLWEWDDSPGVQCVASGDGGDYVARDCGRVR